MASRTYTDRRRAVAWVPAVHRAVHCAGEARERPKRAANSGHNRQQPRNGGVNRERIAANRFRVPRILLHSHLNGSSGGDCRGHRGGSDSAPAQEDRRVPDSNAPCGSPTFRQ